MTLSTIFYNNITGSKPKQQFKHYFFLLLEGIETFLRLRLAEELEFTYLPESLESWERFECLDPLLSIDSVSSCLCSYSPSILTFFFFFFFLLLWPFESLEPTEAVSSVALFTTLSEVFSSSPLDSGGAEDAGSFSSGLFFLSFFLHVS